MTLLVDTSRCNPDELSGRRTMATAADWCSAEWSTWKEERSPLRRSVRETLERDYRRIMNRRRGPARSSELGERVGSNPLQRSASRDEACASHSCPGGIEWRGSVSGAGMHRTQEGKADREVMPLYTHGWIRRANPKSVVLSEQTGEGNTRYGEEQSVKGVETSQTQSAGVGIPARRTIDTAGRFVMPANAEGETNPMRGYGDRVCEEAGTRETSPHRHGSCVEEDGTARRTGRIDETGSMPQHALPRAHEPMSALLIGDFPLSPNLRNVTLESSRIRRDLVIR